MDLEKLIEAIDRGEIALHQLDRILRSGSEATRTRRLYLERRLGISLGELDAPLPFDDIVGRNCENTIGAAILPMGIAGPLKVSGQYFRGEAFIPLATTEGALVASVNRGCSAITEAGGAQVFVLSDRMTRAPVLETPSLRHSVELVSWIMENRGVLIDSFSSTTRYGRVTELRPFIAGRYVFLRIEASTGDAMGMNMLSKGSEEVARKIQEAKPWARYVALSSNLCSDKKQSAVNWVLGRGKSVSAEVVIPKRIVESKLKTSPREVEKVALTKLFVGSSRAGVIGGNNAHVANVLAAIFIATGQDPAQVVESSMALTYAEELDNGDLYVSTTLPSLELGTVGGGTWLPTQRRALEIMGVAGSGESPGVNAMKLAEITTAAVLAGELNLLAAIAAHHLAEAHMRLGRKGG